MLYLKRGKIKDGGVDPRLCPNHFSYAYLPNFNKLLITALFATIHCPKGYGFP